MITSGIDNKKRLQTKRIYAINDFFVCSKINVSNSPPVNLASSRRDERGYL
jgi:hypothetical protein